MARSSPPRRATVGGVLVAALASALAGSAACGEKRPQVAPALLSATGLYADPATHRVAAENLPFAPQYPLWTDGAAKRRWLFLPRGTSIDASQPGAWVFPVGTKLWKEFAFGRRVETRYMERRRDGTWLYATYVWDEAERDAVLAPERGVRDAAEIRPGIRHDVPGRADCRACHEGRPSPVLGVDALQLSPDRDPGALHAGTPEPGAVDLRALVERGLVRGLPADVLARPPRIVARSPRERAVLGYLHGNCAGCHNRAGPLGSLGLSLEADRTAPGQQPAALATAVARESRYQLAGAPGTQARVEPGAPERSVLLRRLAATAPSVRMPPLGTQLVDEEAVRLVRAWIAEDLRGHAHAARP